MACDTWLQDALQSGPDGVFLWRAEMFAPADIEASINRKFNEVWGDSGRDLSVGLSKSGQEPATHWGGSGRLDKKLLQGLVRVIDAFPRATALLREGDDGPIIGTLGHTEGHLVGETGDFWHLAGKLGLRRLPEKV